MKFTKFLALFLAGALALQSCDSFVETNTDTSRPTEVPLNLIMPIMLTQAAFNQSANPARIAGIIMQYYVGFDAQQVAYTKYTIGADVMNNFWSTGLYAGVLKDAQVIIDRASEDGSNYYEGIAQIIQAMSYAEAAAMFGDIPYSEALQGQDNFQPAYDAQLDVYAGIQGQLDRAITLLGQDAMGAIPSSDDLVFGGSAELWIATAQALKARYLMHTVNVQPGNAQKALDILQNDAFQDAASQPDFAFGNSQTDNNPYAKFGQERPNTLIVQDVSTGDGSFATEMLDREDPRLLKYMETADSVIYAFYNGANANLRWAQNNSVIPYISYVELKFLEAEAMQLTDMDATETLKEAIRASMELNNIEVDDAVNAFIDDVVGDDTDLEEIITEAYFSYFGVAPLQAWTNYKKYQVPELSPNADADPSFSPSQTIPVRFLYPVSEKTQNAQNVQAAIDRQGGDLLDNGTAAFGN